MATQRYRLLALLATCLLAGLEVNAGQMEVSCRNPENKMVEWFVIYKLPRAAKNNHQYAQKKHGNEGTDYGYYDSTMTNGTFVDGIFGIEEDKNNPLANSLRPVLVKKDSTTDQWLTYIVYNDQPPAPMKLRSRHTFGHTKGVVVSDLKRSMWLVHSVPRFPTGLFSGHYAYPHSAQVFGQTILCFTFDAKLLNTAASYLLKQQPHLSSGFAPDAVRRQNPDLDTLLKGAYVSKPPPIVRGTMTGIDGTVFTSFAKSGSLDKDVYESVLAPALKTDLRVQSWRNGPGGKLQPDCRSAYKVQDVASLKVNIGQKVFRWPTEDDHSKWALGKDGNWICIGSINRMHSQFPRGGETMCLQHATLHKMFSQAIDSVIPCPT